MLQFDLQFYEELTVARVKTVKFISGAFFRLQVSLFHYESHFYIFSVLPELNYFYFFFIFIYFLMIINIYLKKEKEKIPTCTIRDWQRGVTARPLHKKHVYVEHTYNGEVGRLTKSTVSTNLHPDVSDLLCNVCLTNMIK